MTLSEDYWTAGRMVVAWQSEQRGYREESKGEGGRECLGGQSNGLI